MVRSLKTAIFRSVPMRTEVCCEQLAGLSYSGVLCTLRIKKASACYTSQPVWGGHVGPSGQLRAPRFGTEPG